MFLESESIVLDHINTNKIIESYSKHLAVDVRKYFHEIPTLEFCEHKESGIRYFWPLITGDEDFYEQLLKHDWYYQKQKNEYDFVSKFTTDKSVLEIGAGSGWFFDFSDASEYVGLEFNSEAIKECQKKGLTVFQQTISDFAEIEINIATYDIVCSFQVLEHVKNPIQFLRDALKCLKKDGYLIISVPSEDSFVGRARNNILNMPPHHLTRWTDKSFLYLQNILDAHLVQIHHDYLDNIHNRWWGNIIGREVICGLLNRPSHRLFDDSMIDKLITKAGSLLGRFLEFGMRRNSSLFVGHTVTAVYRKKS